MTTPSPQPQPDSTADVLCESIFDYSDRLNRPADGETRWIRLRMIEVDHGDGDVAYYDAAGNFLACEEGREEAFRQAEFVLSAYVNGARWAIDDIIAGRGHLQKCFPKIATRFGCPPVAPDSSPHPSV